jgi:hypothetical protein
MRVRSGLLGPRQQLHGTQWSALRTILIFNSMAAAFLAQMLAQELSGARIEQANVHAVPLLPRICAVKASDTMHTAVQPWQNTATL